MRNFILFLAIFISTALPLWAEEPPCEEKTQFAESLTKKVVSNIKCSKKMNEAIAYKESSKKDQEAAKTTLKLLCPNENEFTSVCIVMGKDASVKNTTLAQTCKVANKLSPLCILTAVSKQKTDAEIVSFCSNPTEEGIRSMINSDGPKK